MQSLEDSVRQLTDYMVNFSTKSRRQRINQRNRVERLSPLLDWKNLGIEYSKARQLALRRAYPESFASDEDESAEDDEAGDYFGNGEFAAGRGGGAGNAFSVPGTPTLRGAATPGDMGTLTEEMQSLSTSDYRGGQVWHGVMRPEDEEDSYPYPLVMKVRSRGGSIKSGASTPGGGMSQSLSEKDLQKADAALSHHTNGNAK